MPDTGQTDQALITGRIAYGYDGTNAYPIKVDSGGVLAAVSTTISKTIQTELYAAASLAASSQALSSTLSFLPSVKKATFFIDHSRAATAAFGTNGTEYRIEVSQKATGNDTWRSLEAVLASSAVCSSAAASADCAAGTTIVKITSATAFARGDIVCFTTGTIEWAKAVSVSGTASFTVQDGLLNAHASATGLFNEAEQWVLSWDVEAITRARVVINNNASGTTQAIVSRIACITES